MADKKRTVKPIQIALTEDQISRIIEEAARGRRNLNVESLEDRIAPSRFGLPVFGGAESALPPVDGPELPGDLGGGPEVGNPYTPDLPNDPNLPGDGTLADGHVPYDPAHGAPFNPNLPGGDPLGGPEGPPHERPTYHIPGARHLDPTLPGFSGRMEHFIQQRLESNEAGGFDTPTEEDLAQHRKNILRNLRGWNS